MPQRREKINLTCHIFKMGHFDENFIILLTAKSAFNCGQDSFVKYSIYDVI